MTLISQYGLDSNVVSAPLSAIFSLLLMSGIWGLGSRVISFVTEEIYRDKIWLKMQAPIVGATFVAVICLTLSIFGVLYRDVAKCLAYSLVLIGIIFIIRLARGCWTKPDILLGRKFEDLSQFLCPTLILGYFLLSLAPITEADSLDYHVGAAIEVLNTGGLVVRPEWFHSRLVGAGEAMLSLGFSIGAEQFGSLLQWSGLQGIISVFLFSPRGTASRRSWIALAISSSPVIIPWVASPKPFLLPIAMNLFALVLSHLYLLDSRVKRDRHVKSGMFLLVCVLAMSAATMKLNFMLSGGLVVLIASIYMARSGNLAAVFKIVPLVFLVVLMPLSVWRSISFGGEFFDGLYQPFPGNWPGVQAFELVLRSQSVPLWGFLVNLFVPTNIGATTTSLGILAMFIFLIPRVIVSETKVLGLAAISLVFVGLIFGQWSSRFFLEPLCWIALAYMLTDIQKPVVPSLIRGLTKLTLTLQSVLALCFVYFGVYQLSPGAISPQWREEILMKFANGYDIFRWMNEKLPPDAKVISTHRSVALAQRVVIPTDWIGYVDVDSHGYKTYLKIISSYEPEFIMLVSDTGKSPVLSLCASELYAGPYAGRVSTRNPFNSGNTFDAWLYRVDRSCFLRNPL